MGFHCGQFWAARWWTFFINYLGRGIISTIMKSAYEARLEGSLGGKGEEEAGGCHQPLRSIKTEFKMTLKI